MKKTPSVSLSSRSLALLLAASCTACQEGGPERTATDAVDLEPLQGHWEGSGPGGGCTVTIAGNSLRFHAREDFWFETTFALPAGTDPQQLHATIVQQSSPEGNDIGTVVVAVFKVEGERLTLAVIEDFEGPPTEPVVTDSDWALIEADVTLDRFYLERIQPR